MLSFEGVRGSGKSTVTRVVYSWFEPPCEDSGIRFADVCVYRMRVEMPKCHVGVGLTAHGNHGGAATDGTARQARKSQGKTQGCLVP